MKRFDFTIRSHKGGHFPVFCDNARPDNNQLFFARGVMRDGAPEPSLFVYPERATAFAHLTCERLNNKPHLKDKLTPGIYVPLSEIQLPL